MGLLDSLLSGSQGGYGGLLDSLLYPSPIQKPAEVQQPQYDAMGNYTGITPQTAADPFGPVPGMAQWAKQFQPQSPFTGAPAAPVQQFAGIPVMPGQPQAPQPAPPVAQVNDANVGGYQMPRLGGVADYTPQATDFSAQSRAPQVQAPQAPTSFLGGQGAGIGDRLMAGVQNFANAGGPLQALAGGLTGLVSGSRTDPLGAAQQDRAAIYKQLVPLVGEQKAMLAALDPKARETITNQLLEKKQYGFTKMEDGTLVRTDPLSGKAELAYGGGAKSDTIPGPDGKMIQIPPGLDSSARKTFVDEVARNNAKAAGGELTEAQAKSTLYASKMELSNKSITDGVGTSLAGKIASGLPLGNYAQSAEYQKYKQASSNFITALLRQESGAAISKSEFDRYEKEYMPQPGDGPEVLAQKTDARRVAIEGMKKGAGPAYKSPSTQPGAIRKYNPTTGTIE